MTPSDFRRIALSLEGAEEGSHMGAADFRVGGRIFATLAAVKQGYGNLMLTPDVQAQFVAEAPDVFVPIAGGWGKNGATHVRLAKANEDLLAGALRTAWKIRVQKNSGKRRTKRAVMIVIAAGLSLTVRPAAACECTSAPAGGCHAPTADFVGLGTVVSKQVIRSTPLPATGDSNRAPAARLPGTPPIPPPIVLITLTISESFRGDRGSTVVVQTDTSDCSYPFEVGRAYLVFANEFRGNLTVNKCTATRPAKMSVTTISQLRAQRDRTMLPDLFGFVGMHSPDRSEFGWERVEPVPGVTVVARSDRGEVRTQTADDGLYAFRGVAAGRYQVSAEPPPGRVALWANATQVGVNAGADTCPVNFEVFNDGRISGTVTGADGQPASGNVFVWYAGPDKSYSASAGSAVKNGSFEIPRLWPGQYRLVFSPAAKGRPSGAIYYPGTPAISQAVLIEIGDGTHVDGLQFRVP